MKNLHQTEMPKKLETMPSEAVEAGSNNDEASQNESGSEEVDTAAKIR